MLSSVVFVKIMIRLGIQSGFARSFKRIKKAKVNILLPDFDVSAPLLRGFVPANSNVATSIVRGPLCVFGVLGSRRWAQVLQPIVQAISANVINLIRPKANVHCDDNTVGWYGLVEKTPAPVSIAPNGMKGQLVGISSIPRRAICFCPISAVAKKIWRSLFPIKETSFGVVFEQRIESFGRGNLICHTDLYHVSTLAATEDGNAYI